MPFVTTWLYLEIIIPSEVRKGKTNTRCYHLCVNIKCDTNELTWEAETDSHREQPCVCQGGQEERGAREGMDWELGVSRCKLSCMGWVNNKVLLYSTGN